MNVLAEKVLYCAQMMGLVRWICDLSEDVYLRRVFGRMLFVYLDSFIRLGLELKNAMSKHGCNVLEAQTVLQKMYSDYNDYYASIRDRLIAHRQELPLIAIMELWNEIEDYHLLPLARDAERAYNSLAVCNSLGIASFTPSQDVSNSVLCTHLVGSLSAGEQLTLIGADTDLILPHFHGG